ncbi:MAG: septum formation family protein [Nitriliruptorales bacterium]|nr:septum formation family protein [Nitriliruptorales bacterium]
MGLAAAALFLVGCFEAQGTRMFELEPGDCFDNLFSDPQETRLLLRVEVVPCDEPHQKEVTAIVPVPGGDEHPGGAFFVEVVSNECPAALQEYAGAHGEDLVGTGHFPSTNSWDLGYHWVICVVQAADGGLLTGSVRSATNQE